MYSLLVPSGYRVETVYSGLANVSKCKSECRFGCPSLPNHIASCCVLGIFRKEINKYINKGKTPSKGTREEKREGPKSKQKITLQSVERTMGSPKRKKHKT